jgi:CheY-like chemotaxis protein
VELLKKLRSEPGLQKMPVIVFSNTYLTNLVQEAWKAGATKCLSKNNCTPKQLIELVRGVLTPDVVPVATPAAHVNAQAPTPKLPAPAKPAPPATHRVVSKYAEPERQNGLHSSFIEGLPTILATLRTLNKGLINADNETKRLQQLDELYRRIHALNGHATIAGMKHIARLSEAFEALLKEIYEKPKNINASTLRTVASAIDFLGLLFEQDTPLERPDAPPHNVLVVEDEAISRHALIYALEKAKLTAVGVEAPAAAYDLLRKRSFDLVFLDVDMPGMNGFELCSELRKLPAHEKTPVVFVTGLNDFESRAKSTISGGNDLIAKPFLPLEVAVKALIYVMRGRLSVAKAGVHC